MSDVKSLRVRIAQSNILVAPGVYDALSALIAERAQAQAVYLSGASIAYTRAGRPDIGLMNMSEVVDVLSNVRDRIDIPIIADADNGYGNALNVQRTVRQFERAGANAIQIEDQQFPKRCGHLSGKSLIECAAMEGKIRAALDSRHDANTLIIARTDAVAVEGFEAALDRAQAYADAGADILFVEALRDVEDMRQTVARFAERIPLIANMVEGGETPLMSAVELEEIGFRIAIFPGGAVRALAKTLQDYYASLLLHGTNAPFQDRMLDLGGINAVVGSEEILEAGRRYDEEFSHPKVGGAA